MALEKVPQEPIEECFEDAREEFPIRYSVAAVRASKKGEPELNLGIIMESMKELGYEDNLGIFHYKAVTIYGEDKFPIGTYKGWAIGVANELSNKEIQILRDVKNLRLKRIQI